jgi:predicted naringenin-chalcone synthase
MQQCCFYHFIYFRKILSKITSIATAVPNYIHEQHTIFNFANTIHCDNEIDTRKLKFLYNSSGISTRYSVVPDYSLPLDERTFYAKTVNLEPFPTLEKRMECYAENAATLSVKAITNCIENKITTEEVTHLITVSCTGMSAPGLDLEIMELMNLPSTIFRTSINFMGCYAAVHALKIADAICNATPNANVIIVCTEFCTLHFQKENSIDNITSTLLFADGCAAALIQNNEAKGSGLSLLNFYSDVAFKGKKDMSWKLSSTGFLMTLSGYVPDLVKEDFNGLVEKALEKNNLSKQQITHWCIHPGGKKILEAIEKSVGITKTDLNASYDVLKNYGNMSSPTILFVLQQQMEQIENDKKDATIFGAAFGPGLTMETFTAKYDAA